MRGVPRSFDQVVFGIERPVERAFLSVFYIDYDNSRGKCVGCNEVVRGSWQSFKWVVLGIGRFVGRVFLI